MKLSYIDPYGVSGTFVEQLAHIERIGMNAVRLTFTISRADWSEATEATVVARIVLTAEQFERMRRMVGHPDQRADKVFNMSTGAARQRRVAADRVGMVAPRPNGTTAISGSRRFSFAWEPRRKKKPPWERRLWLAQGRGLGGWSGPPLGLPFTHDAACIRRTQAGKKSQV